MNSSIMHETEKIENPLILLQIVTKKFELREICKFDHGQLQKPTT